MLRILEFASVDCRHIQLASSALWSVYSEFSSGCCGMRWFALALALGQSLLSQVLWFSSLHGQEERCGFKTWHSGTWFQKFEISGTPAHCCHVKDRPNRNKSLQFDAKICTLLTTLQPSKNINRKFLVSSWTALSLVWQA